MKSLVDICVLCHNRADITVQFLRHLVTVTPGLRTGENTLFVMDNGSSDQTKTLLGWWKAKSRRWNVFSEYRGVRFNPVTATENIGFSAGNNALAVRGQSKWIMFCNNDVFPREEGWLDQLVESAESGGYAAIGPVSNRVTGLQRIEWGRRGWGGVHPAKYLSGFCILIRRDAFIEADGWDMEYMNGSEDLDISARLRKTFGNRCLAIDRGVYVDHLMSQSMMPWCEALGRDVQTHFSMTNDTFMKKHGQGWMEDLFEWESLRKPPSEWASIGVMPNGQYHHWPGSPVSGVQTQGELLSRLHGAADSTYKPDEQGELYSGAYAAGTVPCTLGADEGGYALHCGHSKAKWGGYKAWAWPSEESHDRNDGAVAVA